MARLKTFIKNIRIDEAQRAHNCKHSKKHRIKRGDTRVGVKEGRSTQFYCTICASASLKADIARLKDFQTQLSSIASEEDVIQRQG